MATTFFSIVVLWCVFFFLSTFGCEVFYFGIFFIEITSKILAFSYQMEREREREWKKKMIHTNIAVLFALVSKEFSVCCFFSYYLWFHANLVHTKLKRFSLNVVNPNYFDSVVVGSEFYKFNWLNLHRKMCAFKTCSLWKMASAFENGHTNIFLQIDLIKSQNSYYKVQTQ